MNRNTSLLRLRESETIGLFVIDYFPVRMIIMQLESGTDAVFNQVFRLRGPHGRVLNTHINQSGSSQDLGRENLHKICV